MFAFVSQVESPEVVLSSISQSRLRLNPPVVANCRVQYLRRLLRNGRLEGVKIGQVWLVKLALLEMYLRSGPMARDRRYGPKRPKSTTSRRSCFAQ